MIFFASLFITYMPFPQISFATLKESHHMVEAQQVQLLKSQANTVHHEELSFSLTTTNIAGVSITRSTPIIRGTVVEGADSIVSDQKKNHPFASTSWTIPDAEFVLTPAEALEKAVNATPNATLKNPYVEKIAGLYEKIWLNHFDELRPTYKCRPPTLTLSELQDIYVDAENGEILKIEDSAFFMNPQANLYSFSPNPEKLELKDLSKVTLKDISNVAENSSLTGEFVSVRSCCQYFTCPEKDECNERTKKCVAPGHPNARQHRELISLPSDSLGLDPLMALPKTITVNSVRCTYIPQARASLKGSDDGILGFYEKPIDEPGYASEMDKFSEVQAYYSVSTFFKHIRSLLNNDKWCLRAEAMSCNADGTAVKDAAGNAINPYKVFVNQVVPDMKVHERNGTDPQSFIAQLRAGKGAPDNPVVLNNFTRMGNAAFIPALETLKSSTPRADELLSDLIKPYDHNVFFQGDRDFAYDGDVVFHEFMHAVTTSLVGKLNAMGLNSWGIHSEPGSLNEGWSDYFAAAFTNRSTIGGYAAIKDGFGEASLRNIKNNFRCPENIIGEIHNDGQVWAGALWEIREAVLARKGKEAAIEFDRAVLISLAQAKTTEDFKAQSQKLLTNIEKRPSLGTAIAALADDILQKRGVKDCFRAYRLSAVNDKNQVLLRPKNLLFIPSKLQIGLLNYAPASSQLEIAIPAGARSALLSWRQYLGSNGALMGALATPENMKNMLPLEGLFSFGKPIDWKFRKKMAIPMLEGEQMSEVPHKAYFENGSWYLKIDLQPSCESKNIFLSFLSSDFKYVLENITVNFDVDPTLDHGRCQLNGNLSYAGTKAELDEKGASCTTTSPHALLYYTVVLLVLGFRMNRKKYSE